jgi:hypothetical protein
MLKQKTCAECGITFYGRRASKYCSLDCRFWASFDKSGGAESCWLWKGTVNKQTGYGIVGAFFDGCARTMAHRHAYRLTHGEPGDQFVMHSCDVRHCGNPAHLSLGSAADNWMDSVNKGRQTYVLPGEGNGRAKLTDDAVRAIRCSDAYPQDLARDYGVKGDTIRAIQRGRTWRHVAVDDAQIPRRQYRLELA